MKHILAVGLLVLLPLSANAQVVSQAEILERIEALKAIVVELQIQLAEVIEKENAREVAKRDADDRCEDAEEALIEAEDDLVAYAAETRRLQGKITGTRDSVLGYMAKIDWERAPQHAVLFDAVSDASEEVADYCD